MSGIFSLAPGVTRSPVRPPPNGLDVDEDIMMIYWATEISLELLHEVVWARLEKVCFIAGDIVNDC